MVKFAHESSFVYLTFVSSELSYYTGEGIRNKIILC